MPRPELTFDPKHHRYYLDEQEVPSVTRVLEPMQELDGIPKDILEQARIRGQHVHAACHMLVAKTLEWRTLDPTLMPYVSACDKFLKENEIKVLVAEKQMADPGLKFAGTLDVLGIFRRNPCIFDWKSTATMPRTAGPQTAAYDYLYRRSMGGRPMRRFGVQLLDDGTYKLFPFEDPRDWSWFASALNIWHWRNER